MPQLPSRARVPVVDLGLEGSLRTQSFVNCGVSAVVMLVPSAVGRGCCVLSNKARGDEVTESDRLQLPGLKGQRGVR